MSENASLTASSLQPLLELADALKTAWRGGADPDLRAALEENSDLLQHRSLVVDLAYEVFCVHEERGLPFDVEHYCEELPAFRSQVREAIRGHQFLSDHPELFEVAEPEWPEPGASIEGVVVLRELGRGTFARAYLGRDENTGDRAVVLKLSPASSGEANTLGKLNHPAIGGVHWARRTGDFFVICMPFDGSTTLRDIIDRRVESAGGFNGQAVLNAIHVDDLEDSDERSASELRSIGSRDTYSAAVATIGISLADGLAYLHQKGMTHGDLKPSNVILGRGGRPRLIDFNLSQTRSGSLLRVGGTLPYMAPEQIGTLLGNRQIAVHSTAADVFSLGVVLFEALTGRLPKDLGDRTDSRELAEQLQTAWTSPAVPVRSVTPQIPRRLGDIVDSCLAIDPSTRPSARLLHEQLKRSLRPDHRVRNLLVASFLIAALGWQGTEFLMAPDVKSVQAQSETRFQRGCRLLRDGQTSLALAEFESHRLEVGGPKCLAYIAYCHSCQGHHAQAEALYGQAIENGYAEGWVYSNRAYSLAQMNPQPGVKLQEALELVTVAMARDPEVRAIQFNFAWIRFLSNLDSKTKRLDDPQCVQTILEVLKAGPSDADAQVVAARIFAASSADNLALKTQAIEFARKSIEMGRPVKAVVNDLVLRRHLLGQKEFEALTHLSDTPPQPALNLQHFNPVN